MQVQALRAMKSMTRIIGPLLVIGLLSGSHHALAQEGCPIPPGVTPVGPPSVTAQQVENGSASMQDFTLAIRSQFGSFAEREDAAAAVVYLACLFRLQDSPYRSGSTYITLLTPDGRVYFHGENMALRGRLLNPLVYGSILAALGVSQTDLVNLASPDPNTVALATASLFATLSQNPDSPLDGIAAAPGVSGHAAVYTAGRLGIPIFVFGGFDLQESHVIQEAIDYGDPAVTAKDVVDRESLKAFVAEVQKFAIGTLSKNDPSADAKVQIALRDPNGPWRDGPVYVYILDLSANVITFHAAFPNRFEFRPLIPTVRDAVTGELVLPQVIAAATSSPEGGFVEYYWDDPSDDSDRADIPKVGYAREVRVDVPTADGRVVSVNLVIGSGFYRSPTDGAPSMTGDCSDRNVAASAIRTQGDVRAFVECAREYLAEHGTAEARRAFNEDDRWKHGSAYVFVDGIAKSGAESMAYVYPPDPAREGKPWGESIDDFGTDYFYEVDRIMQAVDSGWIYYSFINPATGRRSPKASYVTKVDWDGASAALGAGIYSRDWPGTCHADEVSAAALSANPSPETLREFVRCAAMVVESDGYFAMDAIEDDERWTDGADHYVFVMDMMGNQVMTGNRLRVNGKAFHEGGRGGLRGDQFRGRDMIGVAEAFGESYMYYRWYNPRTGAYQPKLGFVKRIVAHGVPLLVGAGYSPSPAHGAGGPGCADNYATAAAVRTQADVQAFVRCAAEYVQEHGEEEARRAFNKDARWKSGPTYVFVDGLQPSGANVVHVFPPDRSREGTAWGPLVDRFGNDYFEELHRIMSLVHEGWIYYSFDNPETGRSQPKSSYVMEIDWNGERAAIGAGIYARDLPGTCDPSEVNAADLAANPDNQRLTEFVRCAAMEVEAAGYFAGPVLTSDPRWKHGPIYIFAINAETGRIEFSGNRASFAVSGRIPEALFDGRDAIEAGVLFGESFWYYNFRNSATEDLEAKTSLVKLVRAQGVPLLIGSGYIP